MESNGGDGYIDPPDKNPQQGVPDKKPTKKPAKKRPGKIITPPKKKK